MDFALLLAKEFEKQKEHVKNIIDLIEEGNTIPFIARYRKEKTGSCDDQVLRELSIRYTYLKNLEKRKEEILSSIEQQEKLTPALKQSILEAKTLAEAEDLYLPFRPKRRTRATMAKEKGLEPLALLLLEQKEGEPNELAKNLIEKENLPLEVEEALEGALDIIAEIVSDDAMVRKNLRNLFFKTGVLKSQKAKEQDSVYAQYYEYEERVATLPSHRILAINRGEKEDFLKVSLDVPKEKSLELLKKSYVKANNLTALKVALALEDSYDRLLFPSLERELRKELTEEATKKAIAMFSLNLKPLLMAPPIHGRACLGFDPAYRTGCKIAVVDEHGKFLEHTVVYPTPPQNKTQEAKRVLKSLISRHGVSLIAIGNGTASKESEIFVSELIKELDSSVAYTMVNEAGASVYSASPLGAKEFPNLDVSIRSAVSIARRLQDPLAELVKIDPKAIGVGQYQHDMPKGQLDESLDGVVEDCVNRVGVDVNTASAALLSHIAGLSSAVAQNVVTYREENGPFSSRNQLKKVPKLGPKAFLQGAGFLRISHAKKPLDQTAVHPESYEAAQKLLALFGLSEKDIGTKAMETLPEKCQTFTYEKMAKELEIGELTLKDVVAELIKPGRDPREDLPPTMLRTDVLDMKDLVAGMELTGTVRNVIDFGAFVDIGVHQDGLVHLSKLCKKFIKHPSEVVCVGDVVTVWVIAVDVAKKRISLSMVEPEKMEEKR